MNFTVTFTAGDHFAVYVSGRDVGLCHLDDARTKLGPQISEVGCIVAVRENFILALTEKQARVTGQFAQVSRIDVKVPQAALNRFVEIAYRVSSRISERAEAYYYVNSSHLLSAWMLAGFPLTWDPEN